MRYYSFTKNNGKIDKYIKGSNGDIVWISFCDDDINEIYQNLKEICEAEQNFDKGMLQSVVFDFIGEDNYVYRMSYATGEIKKAQKMSLKKVFKQYKNYGIYTDQVNKCRSDIANNYQKDTLIKEKSLIPNYQKYTFVDRENLIKIAFRFKKSNKKMKMPLVIYFSGAGNIGNDNIKQFLEYKGMGLGLSKRKCHILIPQCGNDIGNNIDVIRKYCESVNKLIGNLADYADIDFDKIYIVGCSFGGACVWYSLYEFPNFYAGAIPLMGYFPSYNATDFDLKVFENENIWLGHSENDRVVPIKDDETMYNLLKNAGFRVKMTRYKKYGHKMCGVFFRKESWKKWLFEQHL